MKDLVKKRHLAELKELGRWITENKENGQKKR